MYKLKMSDYTSMRTGGVARAQIVTDTSFLKYNKQLILGLGTNTLFSDEGYDGEVLIMRNSSFQIDGNVVTAESGTPLPILSRAVAQSGLSGLEWACGIPGSVGGAIVMNAGAYGGEIADVLLSVDVLTFGGKVTVSASELTSSYRTIQGLPDGVILSAKFALKTTSAETVKRTMQSFAEKRKASQPTGRTLGSTFKKANGKSAGKYIDEAGLKGYRIGGARVSEKHANFILSEGGTSADVRKLIDYIKLRVYATFGVKLAEEIKYAGEF
ncbi:MAG: UDP-N-acetylmuramate dehydrogenase [Clostridia bacterium]|nr:UDP-N-acetylmuramate dehydrogenase [Clostridia bacterium]